MVFKPEPGSILSIEKSNYSIVEHPLAPGMPYGQEGRRAVVYQLLEEKGEKFALKVFKTRFRVPGMVGVAEQLEPYTKVRGMQACERTVLTASRNRDLLSNHPDLIYTVLMPWVDGPTWQEILQTDKEFSPERSLTLTRNLTEILVGLEEKRLAHCDLSGANLIIQPENEPGLVDLEEMNGPRFLEPKEVPAGSPGYAHKSAPRGIWSDEADRFAGAVLLSEMLCWHDPAVQEAAWGENYFAPKDMQTENKRLDILRKSLETHYGRRILDIFDQAWRSDSLRDCPTFAEWAVALPDRVQIVDETDGELKAQRHEREEPLTLLLKAQELIDDGELAKALDLYRKAVTKVSPKLRKEIEERIVILAQQLQEIKTQRKITKKEKRYPGRTCPICGEEIPEEQEVCPICEGVSREENEEKSEPKNSSLWKVLTGIGISLAVFIGFILILIGKGGKGPLSSLAKTTATTTPTPTATALFTLTPTLLPTGTPTPFFTPNPESDVGAKLVSPNDGMTMVYVPAGEFIMGSNNGDPDERPIHEVYLDAFWMDEHEVTLGQFQEFITSTDYSAAPCGEGEDHPVACVDWYSAQAYCQWARKRLPTEAEWEKAARGTNGRIFPWGDSFDGTRLNFCDSNCSESWSSYSYNDGFKGTAPVGSYTSNEYGLFDMAGNVFEWVADWYGEGYYNESPDKNPQGPTSGTTRVDKGGSFARPSYNSHGSYRQWGYPDATSYTDTGFRCVVSDELTDPSLPSPTSEPKINGLTASWEFNNKDDSEGWGANVWDTNDLGLITVKNGFLTTDSSGNNPMIYLRNLSINSDQIAKIEIRMRVSAGRTGNLHFSTENIDMNDHHHPFSFLIQPGEEFVSYNFNTQTQSGWSGVVTELRLDPTKSLAHIEIDYIRLYTTAHNK